MFRLIVGMLISGSKFTGEDNTSDVVILCIMWTVSIAYERRDPKYLSYCLDGHMTMAVSGDNVLVHMTEDDTLTPDMFRAYAKKMGQEFKDDYTVSDTLFTVLDSEGRVPLPGDPGRGPEFLKRHIVIQPVSHRGGHYLRARHVRGRYDYLRKLKLSAGDVVTPADYLSKLLALMADSGGDRYHWGILVRVMRSLCKIHPLTVDGFETALARLETDGKLYRQGITPAQLREYVHNPKKFLERVVLKSTDPEDINKNEQDWDLRLPRITNTGNVVY